MVKSAIYKTEVDLQALTMQNAKSIAVGNAKMNARGDIVGPGGKIIKTREEINKEYYEQNPNAVEKVSTVTQESIAQQLARRNAKHERAMADSVDLNEAIEKAKMEAPVKKKNPPKTEIE